MKKTGKTRFKYESCTDKALRASSLCHRIKFTQEKQEVEPLIYKVVDRCGDIIELYTEKNDTYLRFSLSEFLRCIRNYKYDCEVKK